MTQPDNVIDLNARRRAPPTDEDLIARGFEAVYRAYVAYVAGIGHRLLGRPDEVEDLVQDVFVEVHLHLHKVKQAGALKGWLATITTRKALRRLKRRKLKRMIGLDDHPGYAQLRHEGLSADQEVLLTQVFSKLDDLPPLWRVMWILSHLEGKQNAEIAQLCDCSVTTVKRHLASARELLREVFGHE